MKMKLEYISLEKIRPNPFQPRETFNKEKIEELAESIKEKGLIEPILVRKKGETYEIIAGERRWRAYQFAGLRDIPVLVKDVDDLEAREISLIENWHRIDLEPNEKEKFIYRLWEQGKEIGRYESIRDIAKKTGIPSGTVKELILANEERKEVTTGGHLTYTDFRAARPVKEDKKVWGELLRKRSEGKIKRDDLQKTAYVLRESPKVKEAVKQGYVSLDEVVKLSSKNLEPEEVKEKIMEEEPIIAEIDTGMEIICPICNKKLRVIHKDPEGHKIKEIEER